MLQVRLSLLAIVLDLPRHGIVQCSMPRAHRVLTCYLPDKEQGCQGMSSWAVLQGGENTEQPIRTWLCGGA